MKKNYQNQFEDTIQRITVSTCKQTMFEELRKGAVELEYDYFAFGYKSRFQCSAPKIEAFNNYPSTWNKRYLDDNLAQVDPLLKLGMQTKNWINWDSVCRNEHLEFWEEAASYGISHGISKPTHSTDGYSSMFSLARDTPSDIFKGQEVAPQTNLLYLTAEFAFSRLCKPSFIFEERPSLTKRELEILKWVSVGKSGVEISIILGIAAKTVAFHMANINRKMGVTNKTAAAIKAVMMGLF
ncbi:MULTISPECIES: autoinducer binding domain-containing protein [Vibrio]|uniref:autoinducer binding domain-containing protein n=1 Tax=Vibrio TaxID=662 RepID=UPI000841BDE8|nr:MULTISPECIES: autoinducer binding domain-containing protein [Vibrio]ODM57051.1 hypothetical protein BC455_18335 [Vibrio harveyi]USD58606.1 autoinducer binding domain-containing protein [Vibrio sp. SCSIO 43155]